MQNPFNITGMCYIANPGTPGSYSGTYQPSLIQHLPERDRLKRDSSGQRHWEDCRLRLATLATLDNVPGGIHDLMLHPEKSTNTNISLRLDNGDLRNVDTVIVEFSLDRPRTGGIRIDPNADYAEIKAQALRMHWKVNLHEALDYSGARSGIEIAPSLLSMQEQERLVKAFTRLNYDRLGDNKYCPSTDLGFGPRHAEWVRSAYHDIKGYDCPGVITGKPVYSSGLRGRLESGGVGLKIVLRETFRQLGKNVKTQDLSVAIQGFGTIGRWAAHTFVNSRAKVVAISDSTGGVYAPEGLNVQALLERKREGKPVTTNPLLGRPITNDELLVLRGIDVLIPAAVGDVISEDNAPDIQAKIILEGANGPTSSGADRILNERGILVIPDILANAGAVTASHLERIQGTTKQFFTQKYVHEFVGQQLRETTQRVFTQAREHNLDLRTSAGLLAMLKVITVMQHSGWEH